MASHIQVVLKHDVDNLGHSGEVVRVRPGYARNFLVPRGLAVVATRGNVKHVEHEKKLALARLEKTRTEATKIKNTLDKVELEVSKQTGDEGKLYGSVTAAEIAEALESKGHTYDKRKIVLPEKSIKQVGTYDVGVKLAGGLVATIKLEVKEAK